MTPPFLKAPRFTVVLPELDAVDAAALSDAVNKFQFEMTNHVSELAALTIEAMIADGRPFKVEDLPDLLRSIKLEKPDGRPLIKSNAD